MAVLTRLFELTTHGVLTDDQGKELLLFRAMQGGEELGRLPEFTISALSPQVGIPPAKLLGKKVTVKMERQRGEPREFTGHVTRFGQGGQVGRLHQYSLTVRPWLWLLTRSVSCRIFQKKTAADIIKEVLTGKEYESVAAFADHKDPLSALTEKARYPEREYCVQYRETDFNFVSRLMEEEGLYYFFVHQDGEAQLKLVDSLAGHPVLERHATIPFFPPDRKTPAEQEHIRTWSFAQQIQPGFVTLDDYDFKNPKANLLVSVGELQDHAQAEHEIFDYPGEYRNPDDAALEKILENGDHYATVRINELHAEFDRAEAECNVRDLSVGRRFTLTNAPRPDQDREYLIVSAAYELRDNAFEAIAGEPGATYTCRFSVQPSTQPFRPARITPEPRITGPQTAVVVTHHDAGTNKDEEISCDRFGRIKVRFHWDRERKGKNDENSSCFIRVAQPWAGARWGAIFLPRVGQEVLVHFLEGDPDQPIIIGSVYNADQMPPYELPANKTQSGIKTRSTKDGGPGNFNEIRFEDKKGHEELVIHAERAMLESVEASQSVSVGGSQSVTVGGSRSIKTGGEKDGVKHGDIKELVHNNHNLHIRNDERILVDGKSSVNVHGATIVFSGEDYSLQSGKGVLVTADTITLHALKSITLVVAGGSSIVLDAGGVTVLGVPFIKLNPAGAPPPVAPLPPLTVTPEDP